MKSIYKVFAFIFLAAFSALLPSCTDEPGLSQAEDSFEGDCLVNFDLSGLPLRSAMTRTSGDAIKNIRNLYVLFYTLDEINGTPGELAYAFTSDASCANDVFAPGLQITKTEEDRTNFNTGASDWESSAESKTQKVTTSQVMVGRGKYNIYAVANIDAFSAADFSIEKIKTPALLRAYQLNWNQSNISSNDAMFGFFTQTSTSGYDVIGEDAPLISLSSNNASLHAWMKRAASKVTIAFDGSKLHDNVNVYVKKVTIKDIPNICSLGNENKPNSLNQLITKGEEIVYTTTSGVTNTTRISSREPYFPNFSGTTDDAQAVAQWRQNVHSESANALYFFENCQGESSGSPDDNGSWKQQTDNNNNGIPDDRDNNILKDTKAFGSYIEVEAYYTNDNFGSQTKGNIIYRFMLGMNTTNDFNARRNNHYKLTLCFKNNANDVDWHIDYSDEPGIYIPETIYLSYTYNTPSTMPIRIVGQNVTELTVTLNSSNWYPEDNSIPRYEGETTPSGLATGFISLTYDEAPRVRSANETANAVNDAPLVSQYWNNQPNNTTRQYIVNGAKRNWPDLDAHGYNVINRTTSEGQKVFEADIPLFTRPLTIYKATSWTGANPYYSSERLGQLTVTGKVDGQNFTRIVKIKQVRRVENPTGIYRRHDNASKFDVTLMARSGEGGLHNGGAVTYAPLKSEGAWRAIVYRSTVGTSSSGANGSQQEAWFTLTKGSQRVSAKDTYIQGDADSEISFTYTPNGTIPANQARCGIIKVEYNDYTCTHYIFVRQGYAPMQLEAGKVFWHTFNLYSGNEETTHPCEAGSLFVRGNLAPAILDSNPQEYGVPNSNTATLQCITNTAGTTTGNVSVANFRNNSTYARKNFSSAEMTLGRYNSNYTPFNKGRIPDVTEWATLLNENSNALVNRAFGVLYGDGVNATVTNPSQVFSCTHADVSNATSSKGMRGTFVYNTDSGRNIFLPIGASGYGRRKFNNNTTTNSSYTPGYGQLQYGFGDSFWISVLSSGTRPLLYNLYRNEGAIYWGWKENAASAASNNKKTNAWDINYKSYDFDYMDAGENELSASYIRLVQDTAP